MLSPVAKTRIGIVSEPETADIHADSILEQGESHIDRDLASLNYEFLRLVRESACCDPAATAVRFGLNEQIMNLIGSSSLEDLRKMANTGISMFRVVPRTESAWQAVVKGATSIGLMIDGAARTKAIAA